MDIINPISTPNCILLLKDVFNSKHSVREIALWRPQNSIATYVHKQSYVLLDTRNALVMLSIVVNLTTNEISKNPQPDTTIDLTDLTQIKQFQMTNQFYPFLISQST